MKWVSDSLPHYWQVSQFFLLAPSQIRKHREQLKNKTRDKLHRQVKLCFLISREARKLQAWTRFSPNHEYGQCFYL